MSQLSGVVKSGTTARMSTHAKLPPNAALRPACNGTKETWSRSSSFFVAISFSWNSIIFISPKFVTRIQTILEKSTNVLFHLSQYAPRYINGHLNCCFQELERDTRNITRNIESKSQMGCLPELQSVNTKSILKVTFISASTYYKLNLGSLVIPQNLG